MHVTQMSAGVTGFTLPLPEGFVELPHGEPDEEMVHGTATAIGRLFGLPEPVRIDQGLAETTAMLLATAAGAAAGGSCYTAAGLFRSPQDQARPIMAMVNCFCVNAASDSTETSVAALTELHQRTSGAGESRIVEFPAGMAVVGTSATAAALKVAEEDIPITEQAVTAWFADGPYVVAVSVSSNNVEDWDHVADMAMGIFETFAWDTAEAAGADGT